MKRKINYNNKQKKWKKLTIRFNNYNHKTQCLRVKFMKKYKMFNKFNKN